MKKLIMILMLLLVIGCTSKIQVQDSNPVIQKADLVIVSDNAQAGISLQELQNHNTLDDCWIGYESEVFDVTNWESTDYWKKIQYYCGDEISEEMLIKTDNGDDLIQHIHNFGVSMGFLNY